MTETNGAIRLKTDEERRAYLADWESRHVCITGYLASSGTNKTRIDPFIGIKLGTL